MDIFRKPLGLVLSGGGALGSWQAGCMDAMIRQGLVFDAVLGFSAGALNGAHYAIGWGDHPLERWRNVGQKRVLKLAPRLSPWSIFSDESLRDIVQDFQEDEKIMDAIRCRLITISLRVEDALHIYSRFDPRGKPKWDGPLAMRLMASSTIPRVFPAIQLGENGRRYTYIDGGVRGRDKMNFESLADCKDVIVVEMIRPDEMGRRRFLPWNRYDQKSREVVRRHLDDGVQSLLRLKNPPRVFRLLPSQILDFAMLSFRSNYCSPAVDLGITDGERFLKSSEAYQERSFLPARD